MKVFALCLVFCFLISACPLPVSALDVSAKYACLIDGQTGRVLFEKNGYETHSMASTTKIMTALLALENAKESEIVTVSAGAAGTEGSSMYLKAGETLPMSDLLYGLMLSSGNDAAIAIAEHIAKDVNAFAEMMTEKAKAIGAKNTAFKNPNGLDEEGHFTTACDLALITKEALLNPRFAEIVATKNKTLKGDDDSVPRSFHNHNKLLSLYPGCVGVKTGFTKKTGRCLVSAAKRDNEFLICVTLNAPNDWNDHKTMLDYGFSVLEASPLILENMVLKSVPTKNGDCSALDLVAGETFYTTVQDKESLSHIKLDYLIPETIEAPIKAGTKIGRLTIRYDKQMLREVDLLAGTDIHFLAPPPPTVWGNFRNIFKFILHFA